ncbi:MAG: hypothetical protein M1376_05505 [Planctomycetes bacterium]|nr:hypothetical protein [Planctomycetota bacterium]
MQPNSGDIHEQAVVKTVAANLDNRQKRLHADKNSLASANESRPVIPDKILICLVRWVDERSQN